MILFLLVLVTLFSAESGSAALIEKSVEYKVTRGEYGGLLAGKIGLEWSQIAKENALDPKKPLKGGQVLKVQFRRIVPEVVEDGVVINIPDRTLYRFEGKKVKEYHFIAAGKPTWQTPIGDFVLKSKAKDPTWFVPPTIQKEMEDEGKDVLVEVPPGPDNPLGKYWLQLSIQGIGLHATNAPQSIYSFKSHGCMRLRPEVAEHLYRDLPVGTKGKIIYKPVKVSKEEDGRVYIEIYKDVYKVGINFVAEVEQALQALGVQNEVDWDTIKEAIAKKDGVVRDVSRIRTP